MEHNCKPDWNTTVNMAGTLLSTWLEHNHQLSWDIWNLTINLAGTRLSTWLEHNHQQRCRNHSYMAARWLGYWYFWAIIGTLLTLISHFLPLLAAGWSSYSFYSGSPTVTPAGTQLSIWLENTCQPGWNAFFNIAKQNHQPRWNTTVKLAGTHLSTRLKHNR